MRESLSSLVGKCPTTRIESTLKKLAAEAGVGVRTGVRVADVAALELAYPSARYFIGSDGRRSVVREQKFGNQLSADYQVMRIAFCKYEVEGATAALGWRRFLALSQFNLRVKHTVNELVGRTHGGKTAVTLQVFVSEEEFEALVAQNYTAKAPGRCDKVRAASASLEALADTIETWVEARQGEGLGSRSGCQPLAFRTVCGCDYTRLDTHAILAAAAPHNPGFQTFIILGSPRYAFYPSAQVALPWSNAAGITG